MNTLNNNNNNSITAASPIVYTNADLDNAIATYEQCMILCDYDLAEDWKYTIESITAFLAKENK